MCVCIYIYMYIYIYIYIYACRSRCDEERGCKTSKVLGARASPVRASRSVVTF